MRQRSEAKMSGNFSAPQPLRSTVKSGETDTASHSASITFRVARGRTLVNKYSPSQLHAYFTTVLDCKTKLYHMGVSMTAMIRRTFSSISSISTQDNSPE
jgi:hypothetical protein